MGIVLAKIQASLNRVDLSIMPRRRRWKKQGNEVSSPVQGYEDNEKDMLSNESVKDNSSLCAGAASWVPEQNASLAPEADVPQGRFVGNGEVYFPVMPQNELAAISVPASGPSEQVRWTLAEHGVCLVTDILSQQECSDFEQFWQADLLNVLDSTRG